MESDLQALERFVVENDALLELEERIGRFNIFDALRVDRVEIRHSNFLAWLLDPIESHGQGALFLRAILMDLFKSARENGYPCPISPIQLDGEDLRGVEIRREWRHIDLLITCEEPKFVIAIENKIKSGEHSDQLHRYKKTVREHFPDHADMYAFLTVEGDEPSEEDWVPYSYGDVHRVLQRIRNAGEASIGDDVLAFLDHYLRLLRGRLMDDPKIDELCERIYKNHRQALELIFERVGSLAAGVLSEIESLIHDDNRWILVNKTSKAVFFMPKLWQDMLPPIGKRKSFDPSAWLLMRIEVLKKRAFISVLLWPTKDVDLRRRVIERLIDDPEEFGLRTFFKKKENISDRFTKLGRTSFASWDEEEGPEEEKVLPAVATVLDSWHEQLAGVPDALRPIVEQWEREQQSQPPA